MQVIVYKDEDGRTAVCVPTAEALEYFSIEEIAKKDVPEGLPFKIMEEEVVPKGGNFDSWRIDTRLLTDGRGAPGKTFPPEVLRAAEEKFLRAAAKSNEK